MPRKIVPILEPVGNEFQEQRKREEREEREKREREAKFSVAQAKRNAYSKAVYQGLKNLMEDILMIQSASRAVVDEIQYETRDKTFQVTNKAVSIFTEEMNKAVYLKMVTGILEITGAFNIEEIISLLSSNLYGPKQNVQTNVQKAMSVEQQVEVVKKVLADYLERIESKENNMLRLAQIQNVGKKNV